ncbi:molybdopterin-dependent oxidoreductase [Neolewinella lacunae]|uniref:Xanthine dehydrogenase family protein molybdopterin-binding subunit n=1 Tax=Neolewinella lacunae TaxID=1517758 RepID=A0A923PMC9_9BACT|nr:molybdopterin cofactor-binding domain-containing protein [Neolewinella lacunae]MBC6996104.1 xanthine dehydrogenase family protein molybdopterin-binding subunit [Neolewinella lacunae]MDN3633958.1 molybdopterin-dependent oxidoreductase [Neolewinella lacunae]
MSTQPTRRNFLKVSAAAGGGFLLGFSFLTSCEQKAVATLAPELVMPEQWVQLNGFLKIGANGVITIVSPNPEIGQNVKTSMPMLIAEELDADWEQVIVEQGKLNTDIFTRQLAGGSQSIRHGWEPLRKTGATARAMLLAAAAQQLSVPVEELTTEKGMIHHAASGQQVGYGAVAELAATLPVPETVALKAPKDFKIIGQGKKNVDARKIATGQPLFGLDVQREGMLIASIVHPPAFGMQLKSVDDSAALAMPGIRKVVTINTAPEGAELQWSDTNAFPRLVAVVGETTWQVLQAKKALKLEWEQVSAPESTEAHRAAFEEQLTNGKTEVARRDGDPEAAFASAAKIIEATYSAPLLPHNTLEPMNFFAHVTADKAELLGPIQTPEFLEKTLVSVLGLQPEQIEIGMTRMGGGFGRRLYGHFGVEAALISKAAGAPIKLVYTREDDMTQGTYRPDYLVRYRAGLDAEGKLIAFHIRGTGTNGSPVFANRFPAGAVDNYLVENFGQPSNVSTGAWRAPQSNFIAGAEQAFLDEVAEAAGKDPIDFRLELFERASKNPVGEKNDYEPERYAGVLKLVREKSNWDADSGDARGVAAYYCHDSYVAQVLDLTLDSAGKPQVEAVYCAVDCGIVVNPEGAINQVEGGIVDGIGHALYGQLTITDGKPQQDNFNSYRLIRHPEAPKRIETYFVDNGIDPTGLGEPSLPPVVGALANALYMATGKRVYDQPFIGELPG